MQKEEQKTKNYYSYVSIRYFCLASIYPGSVLFVEFVHFDLLILLKILSSTLQMFMRNVAPYLFFIIAQKLS